jgi:hypothetical protein
MRKLVESTFMSLDGVISNPNPEIVGSGDRLFEGVRATLQLADTTRFGSGIVVLRYVPNS